MNNTFINNVRQHVVYWIVYALYYYTINKLGNQELGFSAVLASLPIFATIFYTVNYILDRFFTAHRYVLGTITLLLFYLSIACFIYVLTYGFPTYDLAYSVYLTDEAEFNWNEFVQTLLIMIVHYTLLAVMYYQFKRKLLHLQGKVEATEKQLIAEKERNRYAYSATAMQIPAHYLVNTFTDWKDVASLSNPALSDEIDKTYQIVKYVMNVQDPDGPVTVLWEEELKMAMLYWEQRLRTRNTPVHVNWDIDPQNLNSYDIPPTTLISLLENAYKYADISDATDPLCIYLRCTQFCCELCVSNKIAQGKQSVSHGLGLKHLRQRLEYVYGSRYTMDVNSTITHFEIKISINYKHQI